MANGGWYGTAEQWARIEAPMLHLDSHVDHFASVHNLTVTRNHKDWPERSIAWGDDVRCLIQLYLDSDETLEVKLGICASQDRSRRRYWKNDFLCKGEQAEALAQQLPDLLERAKVMLDDWASKPESFEFAVKLRRPG